MLLSVCGALALALGLAQAEPVPPEESARPADAQALQGGEPSPVDAGKAQQSPATPKKVRLIFAGVRGDLKTNVQRTVELKGLIRRQDASDSLVERAYRRAPDQIRAALQPFGYYDPRIESTFVEEDGVYRIRFQITPGTPVKVVEADVGMDGPAQSDSRITRALGRFRPAVGEVFDHSAYEGGKAEIQRLLQSRGYFQAELVQRRVEVSRAQGKASIHLRWASGPRFRFGPTRFVGEHLDAGLLARYRTFKPGDVFEQGKLLELQQRLTDADYFSSIEIEVEPDQAVDGAVPIVIRVLPAKRTIYTGGVSFGTDSGPGVRVGVERRFVNRYGHKFLSQAEYSEKLQAVAASYRIPRAADHRSFYGVTAQLRNEQTDSFESDTLRLSGEFVDVWKDWVRTASLNFLDGDFTVGGRVEDGGDRGSSTFLYPELRLQRRVADDLLNPREGWAATAYVRMAASGVLSDTNLVQVGGEGKYITSLDDARRLLFRGAIGAAYTNDFSKLPPELRYFAGGDLSVRGYGYQDLGPVNARGRVVGGRYLLTASAEYEQALDSEWAVAGFVDGGNAYDSGQFEPEFGVGVGVRWRSPVGLVRLDLAVPLDDPGAIRPHLVIGPDL